MSLDQKESLTTSLVTGCSCRSCILITLERKIIHSKIQEQYMIIDGTFEPVWNVTRPIDEFIIDSIYNLLERKGNMKTEKLLKMLEGTPTVTFTKKDGTERIMKCTINRNNIPKKNHPKSTTSLLSEDHIRVFDLDENGWRSFKIDSVKRVKAE